MKKYTLDTERMISSTKRRYRVISEMIIQLDSERDKLVSARGMKENRRDHLGQVAGLVSYIRNEKRNGRILTAGTKHFKPESIGKGLNSEYMAHGVVTVEGAE